MKNTKRWIASAMALMMASALTPANAFAEDNVLTLSPENTSGKMTAMLDVKAQYTVTIPASVTLSSTDKTTAHISANITTLAEGARIRVTLTEASNTESGNQFTVKTDDNGSEAHYTINKGETQVSVGDAVAEFTETGSQELTFSAATGHTYAGAHTEKLTFSISMPRLTITNAPAEPLLYNTEGTLTAQLNDSEDPITWSCDNPDIIDLNSSTGEYRIKGYGEATITATAGNLTDTCKITGTTTHTAGTLKDGDILHIGDSIYTADTDSVVTLVDKNNKYGPDLRWGPIPAVMLLINENGIFATKREGAEVISSKWAIPENFEGYKLTQISPENNHLFYAEPVYKTDTGNDTGN